MKNGEENITFETKIIPKIAMRKENESYFIVCHNQRISYSYPFVQTLFYQKRLFKILADAAVFFNTPLTFSKSVLADFPHDAEIKQRGHFSDPVTEVQLFVKETYPEIAEKLQKEMNQYHFQENQFILCDYDIGNTECEAIVRCKHLTDIRIKLGYEYGLQHLRIDYVEFDDGFSYSYLEKELRRRKFREKETLYALKQFLIHHPKLRLTVLMN